LEFDKPVETSFDLISFGLRYNIEDLVTAVLRFVL